MEWAHEHWTEILACIGFVVWLVRQEGKLLNTEKRVDHLETQMETMESGLVRELSEVKQSLARIEGYLKAKAENGNE